MLQAGSCVAINGQGVLLLGPSGAGKSDLALRLINEGAMLVADDQVALSVSDEVLFGEAPEPIRSLMEVRGLGIITFPVPDHSVPIVLAATLMPDDAANERLPEPESLELSGIAVPHISLRAFHASATAIIQVALQVLNHRLAMHEGALTR